MTKKPQHISYELAKIGFGIYLINELRERSGKEFPTETDVKKLLLKIDPSYTANDLQPAKQISRYCQTTKDFLRDAREETLDKVAKLLHAPISSFHAFREKVNPALKQFKYYNIYIEQAEAYLRSVKNNNAGSQKKEFCELFMCDDHSKIFISMITYNFGEVNKDLPAVSFSAENDRYTERVLRELFELFDLSAPQYMPGNVFLEELQKQNEQVTFIAVGLFGNTLTEWMSKQGKLIPTLKILPEEKCPFTGKNLYSFKRRRN
jgi:hypothetical protein